MTHPSESSAVYDTSQLKNLENAPVAIIYTEWNDQYVNELVAGCERVLNQFNLKVVDKLGVPGSFELPFGCRLMWEHSQNDEAIPEAFIVFGTIVKGETAHFDYVCKAVQEGILQLNLVLPIPIIFGVLMVENTTQIIDRIGGIHGHKGEEAALTAMKMIYQARRMNTEEKFVPLPPRTTIGFKSFNPDPKPKSEE